MLVESIMSHRGICLTLLRALLVFAWADVTVSQDAELSVGKVRSSADVAFSNGEIDQALKLWGKVNQHNNRLELQRLKFSQICCSFCSALILANSLHLLISGD